MNLKSTRIQSKKTQQEVADFIQINQNTYSNYENEKTQPPIETLIKIADYFNVSLDYLCGRQYNNQIGYIPDSKKDIIKKIIQLDDNVIKKADAYISALIYVSKD